MLARIIYPKTENNKLQLVSTRITDNVEDLLLLQGSIINTSLFKRSLDVIGSMLVLLFILTWLFPLVAILIKLTSRGNVLFFQDREGANKKVFKCLKFRTMMQGSKDVDENGKYLQATSNDMRVTKFGAFLRKTSLDELPQFFNVLNGDMSIVGPRPHPIALNRESEKIIVGYNLRHLVKPGITGLSQVNGYRGETKEIKQMQKRVENDILYIKKWNFLLDIKIICKTVKNIVVGEDHVF